MTRVQLFSRLGLSTGLATVIAACLAPAVWAADPAKPAKPVDVVAPGTQPGLAEELRGDQGAQKKIADIDKQIEQTWRTVEEIRESAQNLRLAHARVKDALENNDCNIAAKIIETLNRSRASVTRLGTSLDNNCKDIDARVQKQLAQACSTERQTLAAETATLNKQQEQVLGMCPDLRR